MQEASCLCLLPSACCFLPIIDRHNVCKYNKTIHWQTFCPSTDANCFLNRCCRQTKCVSVTGFIDFETQHIVFATTDRQTECQQQKMSTILFVIFRFLMDLLSVSGLKVKTDRTFCLSVNELWCLTDILLSIR